jgi:hypothetical protein
MLLTLHEFLINNADVGRAVSESQVLEESYAASCPSMALNFTGTYAGR